MSSNNLNGGRSYPLHTVYPIIQPFNNIMSLSLTPINRLDPLLDNVVAKYNELCKKYKKCKQELKELKEREEKLEKREKELKEKEEAYEKKVKTTP